ncbi:FAD-dependent oxidoreductase [Roseovarius sp. LXJ103]|uniref:flavin monoamine oxidase family protein n=1 Tax=Roseovarius carneus TaxID=2853164 RepID=UPI000D6111CD|nr:NAD(P)/FAD-dependent oxidoreductase [Roseovarius carneus]MBZ8118281.1 FAD-dependent oxidoreductase [Roseovarius carneus]PWE35997.1 FAD-dependent oxidoreductase [Pelagicola sp. LXJ1103]
MTRISRRSALARGAALLAAPLFAGRAYAAQTDVVVIGAGAAGIAAARDLRRAGLDVTVIEAGPRIGGRVVTDTTTFGVPYDVGAHWLHTETANPFVAYGRANGFDVYRAPDDEVLYVGDRPATDAEQAAYSSAHAQANRAIERAGAAGQDVSPASVIPDLGEWEPTANVLIGGYEMAKDLSNFSCTDWYTGAGGDDAYCREGFGTLFAHSARDVEVNLGVAARAVRFGGTGVEVETNEGTITARACVCTVSMGVLKAERIVFDPPLPDDKQEAIQMLTMGHYNHVALQFDENFFGVGSDGYYTYKIDKSVDGVPHGFAALVDASGSGLTYCDLGGDFARQMADAGKEAALDFTISELTKAFGSKARAALVKSSVTDWSNDPLTLGGYASAEPGGAWTRDAMRLPVADRLWFAGEAMSEGMWATVAGAHLSGQAVASQVRAALG